MAGRLTFHIPQEAEPEAVLPLIEAMFFENRTFSTVKALLEFTDQRGLGNRTEIQILAKTCGLLEQEKHIKLTSKAKAIAQLRNETQSDVVHYLLYTGWSSKEPTVHTRLWGYHQVVDALWQRSPINVLAMTNEIVTEIVNRTETAFGHLPTYEGGASFSDKSIRGVRKWLENLNPSVINDEEEFERRYFCPSQLALLAAGWVARTTGGEIGIDLLLTPERREKISKLCLIDPTALDKVLDWMLPTYPEIIQPGTRAGAYGRFIRFRKWPQIEDLAPT
jgi:hypothetical protein